MQRSFILLLFLLISTGYGYGQDDYQTQLTIGVYMKPNSYPDLTESQVTKLESRIINVISSSGVTSNISASRIQPDTLNKQDPKLLETMARGVVCFPKFEVFGEETVEAGMDILNVTDVSLTLAIQYIHESIVFSNLQLQLQGSGKNKEQAINNVIRNLRGKDSRFSRFLRSTREKITNYYESHCDQIMEQAKQLRDMNAPMAAVQILFPIPREVECYEEVKELTKDIWKLYMDKVCGQEILKAKALIAGNDYQAGLQYLGEIDVNSACYEEALSLIENIATEIDTSMERNRNSNNLIRLEEVKAQNRKGNRMEKEVAKANTNVIIATAIPNKN